VHYKESLSLIAEIMPPAAANIIYLNEKNISNWTVIVKYQIPNLQNSSKEDYRWEEIEKDIYDRIYFSVPLHSFDRERSVE
jgi:hypothetical protein